MASVACSSKGGDTRCRSRRATLNRDWKLHLDSGVPRLAAIKARTALISSQMHRIVPPLDVFCRLI